MHRVLTRTRHGLLLAALLCVLLARTAVPAGWMPMADAQGRVVLAPCSGMGVMKVSAHAMAGMLGMAKHAASDQSDRHHPDPAGDHPCSGAGVSVALELPALDLPQSLILRPVAVPGPALVAAIGQGLAAPPPWQTGPPSSV